MLCSNLGLLLVVVLATWCGASRAFSLGVNWGAASSHPLPPSQVVSLLKSNNITKVKLLDADPSVLQVLSGSGIGVTVGIPNSMLTTLNSSIKAAKEWVHDNAIRYSISSSNGATATAVRIEYIAVGDEPFLLNYGEQYYPFVIGAVTNIQAALVDANLANRVKVVVPCSFDTFQTEAGLPSKAHFRPEVNRTMVQLLSFLSKQQSPFFVTILPFVSFHQNKNISLDYVLFKKITHPLNDSGRTYRNSFEASYDTVVSAISTAGFPQMDIAIGKIGWPTDGGPNATASTAETFMKGLMAYLQSKSGTPLRPGKLPVDTYILSLLDEDQRRTATGNYERHWGIFTFDGQSKYPIDLGQGLRSLVNAQNVEYLPSRWCVVNNNSGNLSNANAQASEACSVADCSAMSPGGSCSNLSWSGNISYAFNNYYQQHNQTADSCDFGGLGLITKIDPSVGTCRFSIELQPSDSASPIESNFLWGVMAMTLLSVPIFAL